MAKKQENFERLSITFHQTFVPERRYLSSLLKFAADTKDVNLEEVSDSTGIPTGDSSGKVEPTINYAKGMGLLDVSRGEVGRWRLQLSPLGRVVLTEDPFMSEGFTQWLLHLQLCRRRGGAETWYAVFADGYLGLGRSFTETELESFLSARYGKRTKIVGPMVRMYTSELSFMACGALSFNDGRVLRSAAPCEMTHFPGYGYLFFSLWDAIFDCVQQISLDEFERESRFFAATGWNVPQINRFVDHLADERLVKVDRQTGDALLLRTCGTDPLLKNLYTNLL